MPRVDFSSKKKKKKRETRIKLLSPALGGCETGCDMTRGNTEE